MRIAICDDESAIVEDLHNRIELLMNRKSVNALIYDFTDGEDLMYEIESSGIFDIIFLDIEIGKINGIDLVSELNDKNYIFTLIFISQYDIYYQAASEVQPFWFLDKPFSNEKLSQVLDKATSAVHYRYESFDFFFKKQYYRILLDKIMYFESDLRTIIIHNIDNENLRCYKKLNDIEHLLSGRYRRFIRINRSLYVNQMYIKTWAYDTITLVNGEALSISVRRREEVRHKYIEHALKEFKKV